MIASEENQPVEVQILMTLVRLETKLDAGLKRIDDHEARIRGLEDKASSPLRHYAVPVSMLSTVLMLILSIYTLTTTR